ncbi:MAG TPA: ferric reductase-like transmembrane domain-containing protein [Candidatus Thermoplasmatota archaeon]|nr:ferric reductase-like transmembrane domain-containing protein [Candidatus Thermoplasmatota archaeon]
MRWGRLAGSRWSSLAVLALVAVAAVASAQDAAVTYVPERKANCYECHAGDTPPLQVILGIEPPDPSPRITADESVAYRVVLTFPWNPAKTAQLEDIEATLDLTGARSLRFAGDAPPQVSTDATTVRMLQPGVPSVPPSVPQGVADMRVEVFPGASRVQLDVEPENKDPLAGPDIRVQLFAGREADGEPDLELDEGRRGQGESLVLEGREAVAQYGSGNWTVRVLVDAAPSGRGPNLPTDVAVTATATSEFSAGEERSQTLVTREPLLTPKSRIYIWYLQKQADVQEGETANLTFRAKVYHDHVTVNPDEDFVFKTLQLDVVADGDAVLLEPAADSVVRVRPELATLSLTRIGEVVGYISAILLLASVASGGMLGKASRRGLNTVFGTARRRVAFHNVLSYAIIAAAVAHTVLLLVESYFYWTVGLIWGGVATLGMFALGVTGAMQVPLIRKWGFGGWRWVHYSLAVAVIVFTVVHMLLDGQNFASVQGAVGWKDPLDPRDLTR